MDPEGSKVSSMGSSKDSIIQESEEINNNMILTNKSINPVSNQLDYQVKNQVRNQVVAQLGDQVRNQVVAQVWNQLFNQVWDLVWE
jgi:hypothetical protein